MTINETRIEIMSRNSSDQFEEKNKEVTFAIVAFCAAVAAGLLLVIGSWLGML